MSYVNTYWRQGPYNSLSLSHTQKHSLSLSLFFQSFPLLFPSSSFFLFSLFCLSLYPPRPLRGLPGAPSRALDRGKIPATLIVCTSLTAVHTQSSSSIKKCSVILILFLFEVESSAFCDPLWIYGQTVLIFRSFHIPSQKIGENAIVWACNFPIDS